MNHLLYLDTSALVKLYIVEPGSEAVQLRCQQADELILGPLQETELRNAILAACGRDIIDKATMGKTLNNLETDLAEGAYQRHQPDWPLVWQRSNGLAAAHTPQILCRTLDILHVAIAEQAECTRLITSDERQFALCQAIGLKTEMIKA
jgi:predicted nucleic acid-binding protein